MRSSAIIFSMIALVARPVLGLVTFITLAPDASPIEFVGAQADAAGELVFSFNLLLPKSLTYSGRIPSA